MLQQTQVEQVIDYFNSFISRYPTVQSLANASPDDVMKSWEGLGYYTRAQNLHKTARLIRDNFNGSMPADEKILKELPGLGKYTIHALLSIAFDQPYAVVDGNILRVITRLFAIKKDIRLSLTRNIVQQKMNRLLSKTNPGMFNEAMMELGATLCIPNKPLCAQCPLITFCKSKKQNLQNNIPYKSPSPIKPNYSGFTFILCHENKICIGQRPSKGLLGGLWEFPTLTEKNVQNNDQLIKRNYLSEIIDIKTVRTKIKLKAVNHSYTHFNISIQPFLVYTNEQPVKAEQYNRISWVSFNSLSKYAMHRAMHKIVATNQSDLKIISP